MTIEPEAFKDLMAGVAETVTVVTVEDADGNPSGLTVSAFTSVSADPPIVLVCIDRDASTLPLFMETDGFTVNILPEGTGDIAMLFATYGADRFGSVDWERIEGAGPVLRAAFEYFVCRTIQRTEMGDHWVIYGEVVDSGRTEADGVPLVWLRRGFVRTERY